MKYNKTILKNGLTVIEVPSSDAESVVVDFFIKTGSRSESEVESGISHFLEHFLFKGTKKYPSALEISTLIDSIGGEMNANTGKEHTQFYIKAASKHLSLIFEVLTDMIQAPLFNEAELEREKGVIVEEINMYKDTPMYDIENILEQQMWPKDALGRDIAGTKESVVKFTPQMFRAYMKKHYQLPNMILGVSGKYNKKELWSLIEKYWNKYPKAIGGGWSKAQDGQKTPRVKVNFKKTEQAHLAFGFKGLKHTDKRKYTQSVLSAILSGGMSSRLFTEVREKRGLAYYVSASGSTYHDTGNFTVRAGVQVDKIEESIKVIMGELEKICTERVGNEELKKAKEFLKGKTTLSLEDNQARLNWYLDDVAFCKEIITPKEVFLAIDKITSNDVQKLAKDLFNKEKMSLVVYGPYKNVKVFNRLINVN